MIIYPYPGLLSDPANEPLFLADIVDEQGAVVATVEKRLYVRRREVS